MATHDAGSFRNGFPFSASPFGKNAGWASVGGPRPDPGAAKVTDGSIPEGHAPVFADPAPRLQNIAPAAPNSVALPTSRPYAQRPIARQTGLRLLPLGSFVWGAKGNPPRPRTRSDHSLIWVTRGYAQLDLPRKERLLAPDTVCFIPAGTAFAFLPRAGAEGQVMLLAPQMAQDNDPPFPARMIAGMAGDEGAALHLTLHELSIETARNAGAAGMHCLLGMLALLLGRLQPLIATPDRATIPQRDRSLLERFMNLAGSRLKQGITIADLAEELGTTSAALDHACQSGRGKRAIDLIHQIRLEMAVQALRETRHSPAQIARDFGYASHTHFTRAFVAATGRTPEAFRAQSSS